MDEHQNSSLVWESFKSPADTILPTQVLESAGTDTVSSRQAESNYSKGRFQLRLLPNRNLVLNTFDQQTSTAYPAYYWSNTYDAANKTNSGKLLIFDDSGRLYVVLQGGDNVVLKSGSAGGSTGGEGGGYYYRPTLDFDGVFRIYTRSSSGTTEAGCSPGMSPRTFALIFRVTWVVGVVALTVTACMKNLEGLLVSALVFPC